LLGEMSDRSEGSRATGVGVVGCGNISHAYIENMQRSPQLRVIACGDDPPDRARERAGEYGIAKSGTPEEVMSDPEVELVVNLTVPARHSGITLAALRTGKHVWSEKPLGLDREEGAEILKEASELDLEVGCAPDTILGAGLQTCRHAVSRGLIGEPLAASAFFMAAGPETWHHHPAFFYRAGAGPLFDVGPYYLSALVELLGPVRRVTASGSVLFPERTIQAGPKRGQAIRVATDTFVAGVLEFEEGAMSTLVTAFGVWGGDMPPALVFGSKGVLALPDPNTFAGPVRVRLHADEEGWRDLPLTHHHTDGCENCRGLGMAEMAVAIRAGARPRASADLAHHVLDVMQSMGESASGGRHVEVQSTCQRSEPLPVDARFFTQ
jgi:predicted dehydrogenase